MTRANPLLDSWSPDVEALHFYKRPDGFEFHLVPIDACDERVGRVRRHWKGFSGGDEAWSEIEAFFATVRRRGMAGATGEMA